MELSRFAEDDLKSRSQAGWAWESLAGFGARPAIPSVEQIGEKVMPAAGGGDCFSLVKESLKGYGGLLRRQGDLLGAATCFSLAEESLDAADCWPGPRCWSRIRSVCKPVFMPILTG